MNIILNEDYTMRVTKMDNSATYDLSEIGIYIPVAFSSSDCFLYLTDEDGLTDVVPLEYEENSLSYKRYKVTYKNPIRVKSGKMIIKIVLFDTATHLVNTSIGNEIVCSLNIDNYAVCHRLAVVSELNLYIANIYDKIQKLTEMNIEIYEKIVEARKTDDN